MGGLIGRRQRTQDGLEDVMPKMGPWRHGVVNDGDESSSVAKEGPVHKPRKFRTPRV